MSDSPQRYNRVSFEFCLPQVIEKIPLDHIKNIIEVNISKKEMSKEKVIKQLVNLLSKHFNLSELENLCFELDVDYHELHGSGIKAKSREIVLHLQRRGRLLNLIQTCNDLRPHVSWNKFLPANDAWFTDELRNWQSDRRPLSIQNFISPDETIPGGWRVQPIVFLWWFADELTKAARNREHFQKWLQEHALDNLLASHQEETVYAAMRHVSNKLPNGFISLLEITVRSQNL